MRSSQDSTPIQSSEESSSKGFVQTIKDLFKSAFKLGADALKAVCNFFSKMIGKIVGLFRGRQETHTASLNQSQESSYSLAS